MRRCRLDKPMIQQSHGASHFSRATSKENIGEVSLEVVLQSILPLLDSLVIGRLSARHMAHSLNIRANRRLLEQMSDLICELVGEEARCAVSPVAAHSVA